MMEIESPLDQYAQVNSINTRYWSLGDQGSTVILLHGGGASVEFWWYNVDAWAQSHRVCAVDMVGSGRSDQPLASYSLSDQAQFIKDFMDTRNICCASLVGNSMGGGVALQFALMFPDRLEKLVLVNSFGLGKQIEIFSRLGTLPFIDKLSRVFRPNRASVAWFLNSVVYDPSVITDEWFERIYQLAVLPGALSSLVRLSRANLNVLGVRSRVFRPIVHQLSKITYIRSFLPIQDLDPEVKEILDQIELFTYNLDKGFFHWEYGRGLDSGTFPQSIETKQFRRFQNWIKQNQPTTFDELESLLVGSI